MMRYGSVCSGIEAATAAWHPLGWTAAFYSEIEPFPRAVLAHHYPQVPLHGDFTTIGADEYGAIDLLVGGTPCQSFSIAGLRGGLDDDRGNLALEFLRLADRKRPRWLVWENVPGVLSSNGGRDLSSILNGMEELGYIIDIDILDAQFHGVPQRRRRVFICGEHRDHLIATKTDSSALTIAQCLQETLLGILADQSKEFASGLESLDLASLSGAGAHKRMRLFGLDTETGNFEALRANLAAALQRSVAEQNSLGARHGASEKEPMQGDRLTDLQTAILFTLTEQSLNDALGESFAVMRSFITSTTTNSTTQTIIYSCSQAALHIARLTLVLNHSSPPFWSAAQSSLIALKAYIDYARSAGSDLFAGLGWFHSWGDFIREAVPVYNAFGNLGIASFGKVFPLSDSLSGHPAPRREKGPIVAALTANGVGTCGADDNQGQAGHLIPDIVGQAMSAKWAKGTAGPAGPAGAEHHNLVACQVATTLRSRDSARGVDSDCADTLIAHSLRGEGFDASEDGTGRGTPLVPVAFDCKGSQVQVSSDGQTPTLRSMSSAQPHDNGGGQLAVAFAENTRHEIHLEGGDGSRTGALSTGGGKPGQGVPTVSFAIQERATSENLNHGPQGKGYQADVAYTLEARNKVQSVAAMSVRRLTPRECERLQGFPDDYTLVPNRGKPAADGPRYKVLGNSMAVPVMAWIGKRIQMVECLPPC